MTAVIAASLAGKRIAITGATGFVGTALVERLLRGVPECSSCCSSATASAPRPPSGCASELLKNDAFDRLRGASSAATSRSTRCARGGSSTIAGDVSTDGLGLSDGRPRRARRAATSSSIRRPRSSFDSPLDSAVEINLLGPTRIAETLNALGVTPHLVAVSTCYVAGNRRGNAPEELVRRGRSTSVSTGARGGRRPPPARRHRGGRAATPAGSSAFRAEARARARRRRRARRWPPRPSSSAQRWVTRPPRRSRAGARGERRLARRLRLHQGPRRAGAHRPQGRVPVSIVRPSIIESAWAEPRPGWIRGFRMAEPVIISYARGLLREFPGVPEGTVDVIPVDLVVAAIIAVAAIGPERAPAITQVASGSVNPLKYRTLVDNVSALVHRPPAVRRRGPADRRAGVAVPRPRAGAGTAVAGQDGDRPRRAGAAGAAAARPSRPTCRPSSSTKRQEVERALEYVELYGLYTECEAIYQVDHLLGMLDELDDADRERVRLRPARTSTGPTTSTRSTCRRSFEHARVKTAPGKTSTDRSGRLRRQVLSPAPPPRRVRSREHADRQQRRRELLVARHPPSRRTERAPLRRCGRWPRRPACCALDRTDRSDFLRYFYRRYEHAPVEQIETDAAELLAQVILTKSFPAGMRRVREHRALGHRTVLITGALDFAVDGLRPLFDEIIAAEMSVDPTARYSGEMSRCRRPARRGRRSWPTTAAAEGLRLEESRRLRRLDERPADARGRRLPGGGQPGDPAGGDRPQARLARRALVEGGRRPPPAAARSAPLMSSASAAAPSDDPLPIPKFPRIASRRIRGRASRPTLDRAARARIGGGVKALQVRGAWRGSGWRGWRRRSRRRPRCASGRSTHQRRRARAARAGLAPGPTRLAGICGSRPRRRSRATRRLLRRPRLSSRSCPATRSSATLDDGAARVVLDPVLGHAARGFEPPFADVRPRRRRRLRATGLRPRRPGIQTGFCCATGGGWATELVAHDSQLHHVARRRCPTSGRCMIEPLACAASTPRSRRRRIGRRRRPASPCSAPARSGLLTVPALRHVADAARVVVAARYPHQQRAGPGARRRRRVPPRRAGAASCAASRLAMASATSSPAAPTRDRLRRVERLARRRPCRRGARAAGSCWSACRPRSTLDLTALWHRETELVGALRLRHRALRDGADARALRPRLRAAEPSPGRAGCRPPIRSPTTRTRIAHAAAAGRRGAVKVAFDLARRLSGTADAPTWVRPRRRPLDAADAVLARRGLQPREAARRPQPGDLPARAARRRSRTSTAPSATRCCIPIDTDPLPALLFPGMKLTIAFDDVCLPLPRCAGPTCASA